MAEIRREKRAARRQPGKSMQGRGTGKRRSLFAALDIMAVCPAVGVAAGGGAEDDILVKGVVRDGGDGCRDKDHSARGYSREGFRFNGGQIFRQCQMRQP